MAKRSRSPHKVQSDTEPVYQPFLPQPEDDSDDQVRLNPLELNLHYFTSDPLRNRRNLANGPSQKWNFWTELFVLWNKAERYLFHSLPLGKNLITEQDLTNYSKEDIYSKLTVAQRNAFHVLRCIRDIREYMSPGKPSYRPDGPIDFDPWDSKRDEAKRDEFKKRLESMTLDELDKRLEESSAGLGLLMMELTRASMNIPFHSLLWRDVREGEKQKRGLAKNRSAKSKRSEVMQAYALKHWPRLYEAQCGAHQIESKRTRFALKALRDEIANELRIDSKKVPSDKRLKIWIRPVRWNLKRNQPKNS